MRLTPEQLAKYDEYNATKEDFIKNIDNLKNFLDELQPIFQEAFNQVRDVSGFGANDGPDPEELFLPGDNSLFAFTYINENKNPYLFADTTVKERYESNILPTLKIDYPFIKKMESNLFLYKQLYYTFLKGTVRFLTDQTDQPENYYDVLLLKIKKEVEEDDLKSYRANLSIVIKEFLPFLLRDIILTSAIVRTILALGQADEEYEALIGEPILNFIANPDFSKKIVDISKSTAPNKIISYIGLLENNIKYFSEELLEEIQPILEIQLEDAADEKLAKDSQEILNKLNKSLDFNEDDESLEEYIQKLITDKDDSFDRLINIDSPQRNTIISEAKQNHANIFTYIFDTDPRVVDIYNNSNYRSNLEVTENIPRTDAAIYNPNYPTAWIADFNKLTTGPNIKQKIEDLKNVVNKETLDKEDITKVNNDIDAILSILVLEIEPGLTTFYKSMHLISNRLKEENREVLFKELQLKVEGDFNFPYVEDETEGEITRGYRFLTKITTKVKEEGLDLVQELINKLVKIKRDFIEDKVEALNTLLDNKVANELPDIEELIKKLLDKEISFCTFVSGVTSKNSSDYFVDTDTDTEDLGTIYKIISSEEKFKEKYKLINNQTILKEAYASFKTKVVVGNQPNYFKSEDVISIEPEQLYTLFCDNSLRIPEAADIDRLKFFQNKFADLKTAYENNDVAEFNKTKEYLLKLIEEDIYPDIAAYYRAAEMVNLDNLNFPARTDYYIANEIYNYEELSKLVFTSKEIAEDLVVLHKSVAKLKIGTPEVRDELKELQEENNLEEIQTKIEVLNEEEDKKEEYINENKENWGIRISPATVSSRVSIENIEKEKEQGEEPTEEEKVNSQKEYNVVSNLFNKSWYMTLLPAMSSNLPVTGGTQAPGAQPGLNFRVVNSLIKHKIPGFGPIYQPMGIDTINCTIVGCFTGADGFNKTQVGSIESFSEAGNRISPELLGRNGQLGFGGEGLLNEYVNLFDSFDNYQSFFNEIIQPNKEIEVEINLRKNTDVIKNGSEGLFRDRITGNPKFKGYIKRFDSYYVRSDRMWYIMDVQLTTNTLTSKKCLDLTNKINEAVPTDEELSKGVQTDINYILNCFFKDQEPIKFRANAKLNKAFQDITIDRRNIQLSDQTNAEIKFSINKKGYGVIYEEVKKERKLLQGPLSPSQVYNALHTGAGYNWGLKVEEEYILKARTIEGFSKSGNLRNLVGESIKISDGILIDILVYRNPNKSDGFLPNLKRELRYDSVSGNLVEITKREFKNEYDARQLLLNPNFTNLYLNKKDYRKTLHSLNQYFIYTIDEDMERCRLGEDKSEDLDKPFKSNKSPKVAIDRNYLDPKRAKLSILNLVRLSIKENSVLKNRKEGSIFFLPKNNISDSDTETSINLSQSLIFEDFNIDEYKDKIIKASFKIIREDGDYLLRYRKGNSALKLEGKTILVKVEHNYRTINKDGLIDISVSDEVSSFNNVEEESNNRNTSNPIG